MLIDGLIGYDWHGDAAIDQIAFHEGHCHDAGKLFFRFCVRLSIIHPFFRLSTRVLMYSFIYLLTYLLTYLFIYLFVRSSVSQHSKRHLYFGNIAEQKMLHVYAKGDMQKFQIDDRPAHSGWQYQFTLEAYQTRTNRTSDIYFIYHPTESQRLTVSKELYLGDMKSAPLDFFFATTPRKGVVKIKIIDRGLGAYQKIALESDTICYGEKEIDAFLSRVVVQGKLQCLS